MTIEEIVENALDEDVGTGDVTSNLCVPEELRATGRFVAREPIVLAGVDLLPVLFGEIQIHHKAGDSLAPGDVIATVHGAAELLLTYERVSLNFLQRLSGIATLTRQYVDTVAGTKCRILDTRKTTPGLRQLEKMAVVAGGGVNHRMGLFDAVLIKNNHITAAGGVKRALEASRHAQLPIEIEVRTREELQEALEWGAKRILLDNVTPEQACEFIRMIDGRAIVELSGGMSLENVRAYAETGADFISVGALTHSARAVDINFRLELA